MILPHYLSIVNININVFIYTEYEYKRKKRNNEVITKVERNLNPEGPFCCSDSLTTFERVVTKVERNLNPEGQFCSTFPKVDWLLRITSLPDVLIHIIQEYIPKKTLVFLNKQYYVLNHSHIRKMILKNEYENYIRDTVRRDHAFVFEHIVKENFKRWLSIRDYRYKNSIYSNYVYFLKDFCLINDSTNCRNFLNSFLKEQGIGKNQHKKNLVKNIRI
jgi:hypothetical protein